MANTIDIVIPDLGDFDEVEVIEILVASGDSVEKEDGLLTVETDKASMDIPAPEDGVITALSSAVGDMVSAGDVIGQMSVAAGKTDAANPPSGDSADASIDADDNVETATQDKVVKPAGEQTLVVPDLGTSTMLKSSNYTYSLVTPSLLKTRWSLSRLIKPPWMFRQRLQER